MHQWFCTTSYTRDTWHYLYTMFMKPLQLESYGSIIYPVKRALLIFFPSIGDINKFGTYLSQFSSGVKTPSRRSRIVDKPETLSGKRGVTECYPSWGVTVRSRVFVGKRSSDVIGDNIGFPLKFLLQVIGSVSIGSLHYIFLSHCVLTFSFTYLVW